MILPFESWLSDLPPLLFPPPRYGTLVFVVGNLNVEGLLVVVHVFDEITIVGDDQNAGRLLSYIVEVSAILTLSLTKELQIRWLFRDRAHFIATHGPCLVNETVAAIVRCP